jgi:hypothetical protein
MVPHDLLRKIYPARHWWPMPIILAAWETDAGRIAIKDQSVQIE